jgi:hypothetical protein
MQRNSVLLKCTLVIGGILLLGNPVISEEQTQASAINAPPAASPSGVISGTLIDVNGPITDAQVILQTFKDEKCVKVFLSKRQSATMAQKLEACSYELPAITPNNQGQYEFTNRPAGWYLLIVIWDMKDKPQATASVFQKGDFVISYSSTKDKSGKYDGMAQGKPFYFPGKENFGLDFDYRKGSISKSTTMEQ